MCMCMCMCICMCMCMCMRKCVCVCRNWKLEDIFCILKLTMDNRKWNEIRIKKMMQNRFGNEWKSLNFGSPGLAWRSWAIPLTQRLPKMRVGFYLAEFGDVLGLILSPRWPKLGQNCTKMALCWPTWSPRWSTWHHFGSHLGSYFGSWARS